MPNSKSMSYKTIFLLISLLMLILTSLRIGWVIYHSPPDHPEAERGVIDLRDWTFNDNQAITLNGEWEFYPNEFLQPNVVQNRSEQADYISVPGNWLDVPYVDNNKLPYGYGTYRLKILLPDDDQQLYGIRMNRVDTAASVYINGLLVTEAGKPSESIDDNKGYHGPFSKSFHRDDSELELIVHVSNYKNFQSGGITKSVYIGTETATNKIAGQSKTLQIVVSVIFLLHGMYVFIIYLIGKGRYQKELFYYGLMLVFAASAILIDDDIVIQLPISYVMSIKILSFLFISTLFCLVFFIKHLLQIKTRFCRFLSVLFFTLIVFILIVPFEYFTIIIIGTMIFYIASISFLFFHTIRTVRSGYPDGIFILIFITSYTSNMIWGAGINFGVVEIPYYPFDFLIYIISIAILLFKRHMRVVELNEEQTKLLQTADKIKDEFLANTSHELRNPLHGIINIAQTTLDEGNLSEEGKENLTLLIDVGKRMSYTLNDLSAVAQLNDGKVKLYKQNVNLQMIVSLVIDMLHFLKEGKHIKLKSNIPPTFPEVLADENRLIQILFNLVHNAIKYTEEGSISVEADYSDTMATIYVKDTGVGIPKHQNMESIFQAYERGEGDQDVASGVGIGLSVSKQLVELHGGKITYESTDEGTTFLFTIPLANKDLGASTNLKVAEDFKEIAASSETVMKTSIQMDAEYANNKKATVLVIDDDPVNVKVLQQMLVNDYHIITALSTKEALQKIESNRLDLIISDVMMPYMSGYELTKKIREQYTISELPILLITARNLPEDIHIAFESGANDYLTKPVNTLELKTRVAALTGLKRSVKELLRFEAAWLQAQIHPHFLFNTLNSIASLAEIDNDRMVALLEAFGSYLQKSFAISNVESEISLADELQLTRSYVHIEKERFGDRVQVEFDVDENIDILIPPLSIQPLVENAIMHGILQKAEGGTVTVNVREIEDYVAIKIKDDGVGMTKSQVKELLRLHHSLDEGIGVKNTNRRLIQLYGSGLSIESQLQKGTVVKFQIPKSN